MSNILLVLRFVGIFKRLTSHVKMAKSRNYSFSDISFDCSGDEFSLLKALGLSKANSVSERSFNLNRIDPRAE